jgi:predicted MFS family arabinose efflux permease
VPVRSSVAARPPDRAFSSSALGVLWVGRFLGNWSLRFVYSFLPAIASGLKVSEETVGVVAGVRELAGVSGPWLARLVDRGPRRVGLAVGLATTAVASLSMVVGGLAGFAAGMVLAGVAKVAYDVAANAWIGDHVPFARRGKITGLFETSWAAAFLIGVPLTGVLIDRLSWRAPFLLIGVLGLFVALLIPGLVPPDRPVAPPPGSRHHLRPAALWYYGAICLQSLGPHLVFASYGVWFKEDLDLGVEAVGGVTFLFGITELVASSGSAAFTDRLGKRRSMILGLVGIVPILVALGTVDDNSALAVALLAAAFLCFEFSIVSGIPLASEIDPDARARSVGTAYAAMTLARAGGAAGGVALFSAVGIGWTGLVAALVTLASIAVLVLAVEEPEGTAPTMSP